MNTFKYIATRVFAALTIAALTGAIGYSILMLGTLVLDLPAAGWLHGSVANTSLVWLMVFLTGGLFGLVLGAPTSIAVMFLTRARFRPWFAAPRLTIGTTLGFLLASGIIVFTNAGLFETYLEPIAMIVTATLGGIIVSRFLPTQQTPDAD